MLIGLVAAAAVLVGQAATVRHRADGAADLAALAAARTAQSGGAACAAAADIATANGGRLVSCVLGSAGGDAADATVRVSVSGTALGDRTLTATAEARAGQAP